MNSDPGVGNHGHYIIFYINEFTKTQLRFGDFKESEEKGKENMQKAETEMELSDKTKQPKSVGGQVQTLTESELKKQGASFQYDSRNFVKMENIQNQFKDDTLIQRRQGGGYSQLNHNATNSNTNNTSSYTGVSSRAKQTPIQEKVKKNYEKNNVKGEDKMKKIRHCNRIVYACTGTSNVWCKIHRYRD